MFRTALTPAIVSATFAVAVACNPDPNDPKPVEPLDPDTAPIVSIDRFGPEAGTLMVRDATNGLPGPGEAVDFDTFITHSLGPRGELVSYYNFDVQLAKPALIYIVYRTGEASPVEGQLPIIDTIPGNADYSDFWRVYKVIAPADYVANTVTSFTGVYDFEFGFEPTENVINCPVVPAGSTATLRVGGGDPSIRRAWYRSEVAYLFTFQEAPLTVDATGDLPTAPIYVTFNPPPGQPGSGPPSGFVTETGSNQTHNVIATTHTDPGYSPLWSVNVYDALDFDSVSDLPTAEAATRLASDVMNVNCPLATVEN